MCNHMDFAFVTISPLLQIKLFVITFEYKYNVIGSQIQYIKPMIIAFTVTIPLFHSEFGSPRQDGVGGSQQAE